MRPNLKKYSVVKNNFVLIAIRNVNAVFLFLSDSGDLLRAKFARGYIRAKGEVALTIACPHGSLASCLYRC